ncbi:MAG: hypothetical protein KAH14_02320 [Clostridiales bacterium]|nr:hypothetical protein [Clostridiales bacterium]
MRITRKYFDSFQLKLIAACAMLIDHTAHIFFPTDIYLRCIGRLAFPIFAFMVAIGYSKTRNVKKYIIRMFIFALIAQIPYVYMLGDFKNIPFNVIFTLLFGLISIYVIDKGKPLFAITIPIVLALIAEFGGFDHSAFGVFMVIALYYTKDSKILRNITASIMILLFTATYLLTMGLNSFVWIIILFYLFAIPIINLYNEKKGISNTFTRWFFYVFYPGHILILVLLKYILF